MWRLSWLCFLVLETQGKDVTKVTVLDSQSGFTLLDGGGRGGGGGSSRGGTIVGDKRFGGRLRLAASNASGTTSKGKGGDLELLSGYGFTTSGRTALVSADGVGNTGDLLVRSGETLSATEAAALGIYLPVEPPAGGSGDVTLGSGSALCAVGSGQNAHQETPEDSRVGRSGDVAVVAGYAWHRGGNVLLSGGNVTAPRDLSDAGAFEPEANGDQARPRLPASVVDDPAAGSVLLRGGSVLHGGGQAQNAIGWGGDVDLAPGAAWAPNRNVPLRHGRVVVRDHSLEERLVVNHSHTQFKGRAVLLDSLEGGLRALAMGKHGGALAPVPAWASFAACSALPGGALRQGVDWHAGARRRCSGLGLSSDGKGWLMASGALRLAAGGGNSARRDHPAARFMGAEDAASRMAARDHSPEDNPDGPLDLVLEAGAVRTRAQYESDEQAMLPAEGKLKELPLGIGEGNGGAIRLTAGAGGDSPSGNRGGALELISGAATGNLGWSGDALLATGYADGVCVSAENHASQGHLPASHRKPRFGSGGLNLRSGHTNVGRPGERGSGGQSGAVQVASGRGEFSGSVTVSAGPSQEWSGDVFLLGGDHVGSQYAKQHRHRSRGVTGRRGAAALADEEDDKSMGRGGSVRILSGSAIGGDSGPVWLESAEVGHLGPLASEEDIVEMDKFRSTTTHVYSGAVRVRSGKGGKGANSGSGDVTLASGSAQAAGGASGSVSVIAGDSAGGQGGSITVQTGGSGDESPTGGANVPEGNFDGGGGIGGKLQLRTGSGPWGSGRIVIGSGDAHQGAIEGRTGSGSVEIATGLSNGQAGAIQLRTGAGGGGASADEPSTNSISLSIGQTAGHSKGGAVVVQAGSSDFGLGGDIELATGFGRTAFGNSQYLKSGGVLKLSVSDQPRFIANGSHVTTTAPMGFDARVGEKLMLSVGGGEGGGTKSPRRALLLLDTGARTPRLLLAARGLSGGLGLRVDPAPEDSVGGNLKMQTGDLDTDFGRTGAVEILTGSSIRGNVSTGPVFVETGECREGGTSGQLLLRTGNVHHGYSAGPITLKGGDANALHEALASGGNLHLESGHGKLGAHGGRVHIEAGSSFGGIGGSVVLLTGNSTHQTCHNANLPGGSPGPVHACGSGVLSASTGYAATGASGAIGLSTGDAEKGPTGAISLLVGKSTMGSGGGVNLVGGSSDHGRGGSLHFITGEGAGSDVDDDFGSGDATLVTAPGVSGHAYSGRVTLATGDSALGTSGNMTLRTGNAAGGAGHIELIGGDSGALEGEIGPEVNEGKRSGGSVRLSAGASLTPSRSGLGGSVVLTPGLGGIQQPDERAHAAQQFEQSMAVARRRNQPTHDRDPGPLDGQIELKAATGKPRININTSSVALSAPALSFTAQQHDLKLFSPRSLQVSVGLAQLNVKAHSGWRPDGSGNEEGTSELLSAGALRLAAGCPNMIEREAYASGQRRETRHARGGKVDILGGGANAPVEGDGGGWDLEGGSVAILSGDGGGRGQGGALILASGGANRSKSGDVSLKSGFVHSDDGASGDVTIATGPAGNSDDDGRVHRLAASAHALVGANAEDTQVLDRGAAAQLAALAPTGSTGALQLSTGNAAHGRAGPVELAAGISGFGAGAHVAVRGGRGGRGLLFDPPQGKGRRGLGPYTPGGGPGSGEGGTVYIRGGEAASWRTGAVQLDTPFSAANASGGVRIITGATGVGAAAYQSADEEQPWLGSGNVDIATGASAYGRAGDVTLTPGESAWPRPPPKDRTQVHGARRGSAVVASGGYAQGEEAVGGSLRLSSGGGSYGSGMVSLKSSATNHSNGGVLEGAPSGPLLLRSGHTWAGISGNVELRSGDSKQDLTGSVVIRAGKSKALQSHLYHRANLAGELAGAQATKAGQVADVASAAVRQAYMDSAQAGGVHLAAGDANAALGGDVCIDAGRGGLGPPPPVNPHAESIEDDDEDDNNGDEEEAGGSGGASGARGSGGLSDEEAESKAARRRSRAAAIAEQRALATVAGEVAGYGNDGDGSVRVRVRGGDATRLLCSSSVVNLTAPQVDVRSGMLGLLLNSAGNTSLVSGSGRAFIQLSTDGTAEVASTGTSTVTLRSRASNSPVSSSSSSSTSSGSGSEESGHRVAGGLLLAVDPTVVANTATGSGGPNNGHPHVLSGGWINLTAGAAVGINGGGLVLESGETTRGPVVDQAEAEKVPPYEGSSGPVSISSGQAKHGHSGILTLASGPAWSKNGRSGSVDLKTGDAPQGAAGRVTISAGSSQVIESTVLSSRPPVIRSTSNGDGAVLIQAGKRAAPPPDSSFNYPLTHGGEMVMRSGASEAGTSGAMRVMSASAPEHSGLGTGAVTLVSGSAISTPKGEKGANADGDDVTRLHRRATSGSVVMASGPAAGRSGDVAIVAGMAGALDQGMRADAWQEQPGDHWWASEKSAPAPGARPLPKDRLPTVSGSSARGGRASLAGGPSGGGFGGSVAVAGGGGMSGGGSVQVSGGAAGVPFGMSFREYPNGYSASALADADAADALAAWRSKHNEDNDGNSNGGDSNSESSSNGSNEEEESEVASLAKGSAGTVKIRGGDAFGTLLPPVQAQAEASCVAAEKAYVAAAAVAADQRDAVKLGPFGSFEDTLSPGQLGRLPRGGGAVLVAGSATSGGVGGNSTVGGGDGYFGGGHLRLRGGLAKGPRGGLTRGGDVELQGGIGAGSDSGGAVRMLSADGSRRLEASDHTFTVTSPLLDLSTTAGSSSSSTSISQSVALRLDHFGARLRTAATITTPDAASSSSSATDVTLELDLSSETGAVFLGHRVANSGRSIVDGTAGIGNVTMAGANAIEAIAYGPGGVSLIATRGPLFLSSAQRGTFSTVPVNYARRMHRLSQHPSLVSSLLGHHNSPPPPPSPSDLSADNSPRALAQSAIALAPGGGSGVGIGPAFVATTLAPRALLHVVAAAASATSGSSDSSSTIGDLSEESVNWNSPGEAEQAANLAGLPLAPPKHTVAAFQAPGPAAMALLAGGANATLWLQTQAQHYPAGMQRPRPSQTQGYLRVSSSPDLSAAHSAVLALGVGDGSQSGVLIDAAGRVGVGGGFSTSSLESERSSSNLRPSVPLHVRSATSKVSEDEATLASSLAPPGAVAIFEERGPTSLHLVSHVDPRVESPALAGSLLLSSLDEAKGRGEHWYMGHRSTGEVSGGAGGLVFARRTSSSSSSSSLLSTSLTAPLAGARASAEWRGSSGKDQEDGSSGGSSGSDGGEVGVDPPALWLDNKGRAGVGGFGPPRAALSVGGAAEAFDFRIAADDAVIGSSSGSGGQKAAPRETLPSGAYATALALVSGVELQECTWDATHTNPASEGSYEQRRRLGFHLGASGVLGKEIPGSSSSRRTTPYRTYLCASAQQVEKAATAAAAATKLANLGQGIPGHRLQNAEQTAELFASSLVPSDERGVRSLSVGRLALLLTAAVKELTTKLEQTSELVLAVNTTFMTALAAQDSRTDAISAHLFGKDAAPTFVSAASSSANAAATVGGSGTSSGYMAQAAQVEARVAALEAAAVAAAEEIRVQAAVRAADDAAEKKAAQKEAAAAEAAKARAAEAVRVADAAEAAARRALEERVAAAEAKAVALTEELTRWREDAKASRDQEQALHTAELNTLKAELAASAQTAATTSQAELKDLKKEVALASAAAKSAFDATSGPAAVAAAKTAQESAAAAATAAAAASAAEAEKGALRQYYLEEVARLEAVKRAAAAAAAGGNSPGTLSPTDRNAARDEALAAVRERQADLKRLRDMGI